jgi:hypothetical protein
VLVMASCGARSLRTERENGFSEVSRGNLFGRRLRRKIRFNWNMGLKGVLAKRVFGWAARGYSA